jgi:hypothetical protein
MRTGWPSWIAATELLDDAERALPRPAYLVAYRGAVEGYEARSPGDCVAPAVAVSCRRAPNAPRVNARRSVAGSPRPGERR